MEFTITKYNFPIIEKYKCLSITFNQKSYDSGLTKIVADIKPSFSELIDFLRSRRLVSNYDIVDIGFVCYGYRAQTATGVRYLQKVSDFCENYFNFQLSAKGYSLGDAFDFGDIESSNKAMKKIRKKLREQYPSLEVLKNFVEYLNK